MSKRWLSDERVTALTNAGRLRENGQVNTHDLSNVEFVTVKSSGVIPKTAPGQPVTSLYPIVTLCRSMKIAEPVPEYRFHPTRKWRLDYAWPMHMVALEVDGGVWTQGRHTRGKGAIEDMEKASEAAILGWRLLYCTPEQAHNGVALDRIIRALTDRAAA